MSDLNLITNVLENLGLEVVVEKFDGGFKMFVTEINNETTSEVNVTVEYSKERFGVADVDLYAVDYYNNVYGVEYISELPLGSIRGILTEYVKNHLKIQVM